MSAYLLRPCKSTAAFEALPDKNIGKVILDLTECQRSLEKVGFEEVCDARVLLIMKKELEVTIYQDGKLILKTDIKETAERIMNEIYDQILEK